jgi:hypothetical protein
MDAKMSANWRICSMRWPAEVVGGAPVVSRATRRIAGSGVAFGQAGLSCVLRTPFDLDLIDMS